MAWEYPKTCGGTHLHPYRLYFPRTVERVTAQGSVPWVRGMRLPHAPAPSNWSHRSAEPTIPNLLPLGAGEIGATGLQQFWNQKKPLRDNWWRGKQVKQQACQLLFWNFFLFGKEKSGTFSFFKKNFWKALSARGEKFTKLFLKIRFFEWEKSYYFPTRIRLAL